MGRGNGDPSNDGVVSIELGVSRRKLLQQLSAAGLAGGAVALAGCNSLRGEPSDQPAENGTPDNSGGGSDDELPPALRVPLVPPPSADEMDLSNPEDGEREMVFVTHVVDEFMQGIIAGVNDGLHKNGWTGEFVGPTQHDEQEQIEILRTTIDRLESGRDVVATTVLSRDQYNRPIREAFENDIPVVSFNTNVYSGQYTEMMDEFGNYIPYVGQEFVSAGVAVGQTAVERAREKLGEDQELVALPNIIVPGHPALEQRVEGVRMALEAADNVRVLETLNTGSDQGEAISRINDRYQANPDLNIIVGTAAVDTAAGGRLVENEGLQDEMIVAGFDTPATTIDGIRQGTIDFSVGQDPYSQGYISTQLAWEYMDRGIPMKDYNTGVSIIDEENIDFVERRDGAIPDLIDYQEENYSV
jgi:ABC-type sugar transport system substrate-binding protein